MLYERLIDDLQKKLDAGGDDSLQDEITNLKLLVEQEENKRRQYKVENIRRKHNYLPLIVEILKLLAKEGKLVPLYEEAKERTLKKQKIKQA